MRVFSVVLGAGLALVLGVGGPADGLPPESPDNCESCGPVHGPPDRSTVEFTDSNNRKDICHTVAAQALAGLEIADPASDDGSNGAVEIPCEDDGSGGGGGGGPDGDVPPVEIPVNPRKPAIPGPPDDDDVLGPGHPGGKPDDVGHLPGGPKDPGHHDLTPFVDVADVAFSGDVAVVSPKQNLR